MGTAEAEGGGGGDQGGVRQGRGGGSRCLWGCGGRGGCDHGLHGAPYPASLGLLWPMTQVFCAAVDVKKNPKENPVSIVTQLQLETARPRGAFLVWAWPWSRRGRAGSQGGDRPPSPPLPVVYVAPGPKPSQPPAEWRGRCSPRHLPGPHSGALAGGPGPSPQAWAPGCGCEWGAGGGRGPGRGLCAELPLFLWEGGCVAIPWSKPTCAHTPVHRAEGRRRGRSRQGPVLSLWVTLVKDTTSLPQSPSL